jgi:organic radical activating enzyme
MPKEVFGREYVFLDRKELLSLEEIAHVAGVFAQLGVRTVRITGGEPLVRRNVEHLIEMLAAIEPKLELALTTNGAALEVAAHERLAAREPDLLDAVAGEGAREAVDLLEREQLAPLEELVFATEDLLRHAVDAPEVAAVGDGDPQIPHRAAQIVGYGHACSVPSEGG